MDTNFIDKVTVILASWLQAINDYVFRRNVVFDNYAAIRANTNANARSGKVRGYAVDGDGGFGEIYLDTTDLVSADNNGTVWVDALGGRWKRKIDGLVNVRWFGADPQGSTYSDTAFANARDAANSLNIWGVYAPMGKYKFTSELLWKTNVSLIGEETNVYHLFRDSSNPRNTELFFENDTDGIIYSSQFFKCTFKNLAIYSGPGFGVSTKVGLRLWTGDTAIAASTTYHGLSNAFENILVNGFKTACVIAGAYSWFQRFRKIAFQNCETGFDIECRSFNNSLIDDIYINCDSAAWTHANRVGVKYRCGGVANFSNATIENMAQTFQFAPTVYTDLVASARDRQINVTNLYTEAILQSVFNFPGSGLCPLPEHPVYLSILQFWWMLIWFNLTAAATEKSWVTGKSVYFLGNASPDNRRVRRIMQSGVNCPPSMYVVDLDDMEIRDNDFETLWIANYPPNRITFKDPDDAGNRVTVLQASGQTSRAIAVIDNQNGNTPTNSLIWTTAWGGTLNLNTMANHLVSANAIRRAQKRDLLPVFYDNVANINGTTKSANTYSGVRYANFGAGPAAITLTIDATTMLDGDEFLVTDTAGTTGSSCTITIGAQTFSLAAAQFVVIRKTTETGASTAVRYEAVSRGAA